MVTMLDVDFLGEPSVSRGIYSQDFNVHECFRNLDFWIKIVTLRLSESQVALLCGL